MRKQQAISTSKNTDERGVAVVICMGLGLVFTGQGNVWFCGWN